MTITHYVRYIVNANSVPGVSQVERVAFVDNDPTHGTLRFPEPVSRATALEAVNRWNQQAYGRYIYWIE